MSASGPDQAGLVMLEKTVGSDLRSPAAATSWRAQLGNDQRIVALFFLLPSILVLCFVVIYPFFSAIVISFQDKMIGGVATYIGLGNYYELFGDREELLQRRPILRRRLVCRAPVLHPRLLAIEHGQQLAPDVAVGIGFEGAAERCSHLVDLRRLVARSLSH